MKAVAALAAVLCFVIAALYWTGALQLGASHPGPHHLHAILFAVLGVLAAIWFRFQSATPARH